MHPTLSKPCEEELAFLMNLKICLYFSAVSKKAALYWKSSKLFAYYGVYFSTTTTLDKIWQSGKFHPVLCMEQGILKINFAFCEIRQSIFLYHSSTLMVDLTMGCYHEHPTMVGELICKNWYFVLLTRTMYFVHIVACVRGVCSFFVCVFFILMRVHSSL